MKLDLKSKFKNGFSKMSIKKAIIMLVLVVIVAAVFKSKMIQNKFFASKTVVTQKTMNVNKGTLKVLVSGSGSIYFTNTSKIYSKIGATVTKVNYKEGDKVKAGDVIYELDDTAAQTSANSNLNSFKQNQISAVVNADAVNNLWIKAPFAGLVSNISVNQGDSVQKGGTVFSVADTSKLKVLLTYNASDIGQVVLGQAADVYLTSLMQSVTGTVTYVSNQATATNSGGQLYTVEIQINNPGAVLEGMAASADIQTSKGTISSTGTAALNYVNKQTVTSLTGGTVASISVKQNQKVTSGQVLITMKNDDVTRAKQNSDLQLANAETQMTLNAKQLNNYKIISPIDGVITKISSKVGDSVKAGDEVSDVADPTQMQFDVPVDELDVAKLQVGQKASITVDALPTTSTTPVTGEVSKVAVTGTSVSGVTTFIVTVKVDDNLDKLKGGMNANGEIEVTSKENILYVPIEATTTINGKSYVMLKGTGGNVTSSSKTKSYYEGSVSTEVEVGSNNDTSIEITNGLKEGDVIVLPQTTTASNNASASTSTSTGEGNPDMGGGPPGGEF